MGFDRSQIVLDNANRTFCSGQAVQGTLIFRQDEVKSIRGLYVKLKGFCLVRWTTTRTRTVDNKRESYTVDHNAREEYINSKVYLVGGESDEYTLQRGNYEYPFHFRLPASCPSSFKGEYGQVRYEIIAVLDIALKIEKKKKIVIRVMAPLDLNLDPYCREPMEFAFQESYCCCCLSTGSMEVMVNLPVSGYCPGQIIPIAFNCSTTGSMGTVNIKLCLTRKVTYIATSEPGQQIIKTTVAEIIKGPVRTNTTRNWTVNMEVPVVDVYNLYGCHYINVEHRFKVVINPGGCHSESKSSGKIIIGTIPLVGFQDDIQNPLHDQIPETITAVTQQPVSSYPPGFKSYHEEKVPPPLGNPPYPTSHPGNPPYTVSNTPNRGNSPYPPDNPPYPKETSSYPPSDVPYPTPSLPSHGNSPYPTANPPYPKENSSYPLTSSPYPVSSSPNRRNSSNLSTDPPYPTSNSPAIPPYPTSNTPTNPPYPTSNSPAIPPYPTSNTPTNPPYPTSNSPAIPPYPTSNTPTNPPYPTSNSPAIPPYSTSNTPTNPPYPTSSSSTHGKFPCPTSSSSSYGNSPYPPDNSPSYPGVNNPPYPPENESFGNKPRVSMPTPGNVGGSFLRTGKIGFIVENGDKGMTQPLLSQSVVTQNPLSSAQSRPTPTAPILHSPDVTKDK